MVSRMTTYRRINNIPNEGLDATMKVSVEILKRVYDSLKDQGDGTAAEKELIDPDNHLFFIDAFEMPRWTWSTERGTFEKCVYNHQCTIVLSH